MSNDNTDAHREALVRAIKSAWAFGHEAGQEVPIPRRYTDVPPCPQVVIDSALAAAFSNPVEHHPV